MNYEITCPGCGEKLSMGVSICPVCATQLYSEQGVMNKGTVVVQQSQVQEGQVQQPPMGVPPVQQVNQQVQGMPVNQPVAQVMNQQVQQSPMGVPPVQQVNQQVQGVPVNQPVVQVMNQQVIRNDSEW